MIYNGFNREISCHCVTASLRHHITAVVSHLPFPCHQTSQSFALPPATKPVSHLTCPLPPHHCITVSSWHCITTSLCVSVICLAPCHQTSQSFDLPSTTTSLHHRVIMALHHRITVCVSHLPCPLPPNQSVICLAPCHQTSQSFDLPSTTASPCHHVIVSVSHLPCPLPPNQSVICLAPCHQTSQSFALPPATKPVSHLT